ncbi:MAG TPA: toll/interleukin-1 receptor domain-containing protein [Vicinamibacterales bacterium]|nr:toll/interleukin-1 receptor domain-containing protein [Vicinamibacterales bacterium]
MTVDNRRQERFWNQLLGLLAKGTLVPTVGEGLLTLPAADGGGTLYEALAARVADAFDLHLAADQRTNLSAVVRSHPEFATNPHDVYLELGEIYDDWKPPVPDPLRALARIRHFNLFVSTTFDDLLERALNDERFGGKPNTEVIVYSPKNVPDEQRISSQLASGRPVVLQLFGNYRTPLQYALTEGDKVEYMHALQTPEYRPARLFAELYERPLLMLGTRFPDWLMRLFLRMLRRTPLDYREVPKQYVADLEAQSDPNYRFFLRSFATNTELVEDLDPPGLVKELAARWQERYGSEAVAAAASPARSTQAPMPKNAVFVSYCASDASGRPAIDCRAATAICDALESRGVEVWFDKDQLRGGDEFERCIKRYIETCSLFMPIISQTTESRGEGFFRREWGWALDRLSNFTGNDRQFLFPVVIGDVNPYAAKVPDEFRKVQFTTLVDGTPDAQFLDRVQMLYENARKRDGAAQ